MLPGDAVGLTASGICSAYPADVPNTGETCAIAARAVTMGMPAEPEAGSGTALVPFALPSDEALRILTLQDQGMIVAVALLFGAHITRFQLHAVGVEQLVALAYHALMAPRRTARCRILPAHCTSRYSSPSRAMIRSTSFSGLTNAPTLHTVITDQPNVCIRCISTR